MIKFYKLLFFNSMMMGTFISISAYSWFSMWIGLEINLLSFIPLLMKEKDMISSESALKYFIIQALASIILLFSMISILLSKEFILNNMFVITMNSSFLTKMGAAPFHFWFPEVMEGLNWLNCMILLTWQKIAPMILLMYSSKMSMFYFYIIILSTIIGGIMGLNQISLRKIMAYSSINHLSWMITLIFINQSLWFIYFIIYPLITLNITFIFYLTNTFYFQQLISIYKSNKNLKMLFFFNFMSLGGLPPFLGFIPKWITINFMVSSNFIFISFLMVLFTLISLYFYIRIMFNSMMISSLENSFTFSKFFNFFITLSNSINIFSLILCTLILNLT